MPLLRFELPGAPSSSDVSQFPMNTGLHRKPSSVVREKTKVYMTELIQKLNDLFGSDTTDQDQLVYVNNVIKGKLLESKVLQQQAASNSKEQFANSPDFDSEHLDAIISALDAHTSMSTKALNSADVRRGMKEILLNHAKLWEALRERAGGVGGAGT